jgi:mannose-6-phosphate isomerase, type 1 (EC 5.3.1.8)
MSQPFLLEPAAKDYIWGGTRLNDDFRKGIKLSQLAETWECSTHPDGESTVNGEALSRVLARHPAWLGTHTLATTGGQPVLPILIKLIDARADLSVQVHPDDDYALRFEGSLGKSEMWYVLAARPGAELVFGFNRNVSPEDVREAIRNKNLDSILNHVPVHKDDLFYIEAGTVHAIGAGCLIAEIQESSNLTYRLYDYDRVDRSGNMRQLHLEKALEVANLRSSAVPRQPLRIFRYSRGCASELLTRCKYFQVERMLLNTEIHRELVPYRTGSNSFHTLLCVDGCGTISGESFMLNFFKGDCIFVPADSIPLKLHGKAQFLDISC